MRLIPVLAVACALLAPGPVHAVLPQDDAGSGQDAPNQPTSSFRIEPNAVYTGIIEGVLLDSDDWYAFDAEAGERIQGRTQSSLGCLGITDAAGTELASTCSSAYVELVDAIVTAPVTGTYYLHYSYVQPHTYSFSLGVGEPAPAPVFDEPPVTELLFPGHGALPPLAPATQSGEHVVVAVVDTGINPYHDFFAAPALTDHPSTWLPGFPADAESVDLTLNTADYAAAAAADNAAFAGLSTSAYSAEADEFETHLYTFPGTRVVGAVAFGEFSDITAIETPETRPVRDDNGHGTHSAGLAAGANLAAADGNVLVVMVEVGQGTFEEGVRWAARQPWIDAISVSLGARANLPVTQSPTGDRTGPEWASREAALAGKPVFVASGNGVSGTGVPPDHCSTHTSPWTGPSWITRIGAADGGNGNPTWWHCLPVDAIARTNVMSPDFHDLQAATSASGTSAATPNAAGHYAHLLLEARRAGSSLSKAATLEHLLHSAAPPPLTASAGDPSVYPVSLASQGYGLIDDAALADATTRVTSGSGPKPRPETTDWFARDTAIRTALWGPGSATGGDGVNPTLVPQDDAGSGGDAPNSKFDLVRITPGVRYEGFFDSIWYDASDWYAFDGTAGDVVNVGFSGANVCFQVTNAAGVVKGSLCGVSGEIPVTLDSTGTWYLFAYPSLPVPQDYSFGFGVNGPPPS